MKEDKQMDEKDLEAISGGNLMDIISHTKTCTCPLCGQTYTVDNRLNKIPHICPQKKRANRIIKSI